MYIKNQKGCFLSTTFCSFRICESILRTAISFLSKVPFLPVSGSVLPGTIVLSLLPSELNLACPKFMPQPYLSRTSFCAISINDR